MTILCGSTLGRYRVVERIGAGGMGEVYRAEDTTLGRFVAIKTLPAVNSADPTAVERLRDEARAVASLSHPHILSIFDFGFEGLMAYAVMELLDGETLAALLARGPIPSSRAVPMAIALAEALAAAHRTGLVHRDLKPANVFITREGTVKILDFGLARVAIPEVLDGSSATAVRPERELAGTIPYMAPEQLQGAAPRSQSDLFSLGVLLWEMLTGRHPFARATAAETITAILRDAPPDVGDRISEPLRRLLDHCLEKDDRRRFQSAGDVAFALRSLVSESGVARTDEERRLPSLVVLPFDCKGDDLDAAFLSDGLAETLINRLSHLQGLTVIARTTAFRYRATQMSAAGVAAELRATWILTGAIRQHRGNLVIQAELVDGGSGNQLWGERFIRSADDVFRTEEEIGRAIAERLSAELKWSQPSRDDASPASSPAYSVYLRGRFEWDRRTRDSVARSILLFEEATRIDPQFTLAWSGLADAYNVSAYHGWIVPTEAERRSRESASRARELQPDLPEALVSWAGVVGSTFGGDLREAARLLRQAIELKPSYATALHWLSHNQLCLGELDEAKQLARRAVEIDPMATSVVIWSADLAYYTRDYGRAIETYRKILQIDPDSPLVRALLGTTLVQVGEREAGIALLEQSLVSQEIPRFRAMLAHARAAGGDVAGAEEELAQLRRSTTGPAPSYDLAIALAGQGKPGPVVAALTAAFDQRLERLFHAPHEPKFDPFRQEPEFDALMKRIRARAIGASA